MGSHFTKNKELIYLKATDTSNDFLTSLKSIFFNNDQGTKVKEANEYDEAILEAKEILKTAAETKSEEPTLVIEALSNLEKLMRQKCKAEPSYADEIFEN